MCSMFAIIASGSNIYVNRLREALRLMIAERACLYSVLSEEDMHERRTSYSQWLTALEYKDKLEAILVKGN